MLLQGNCTDLSMTELEDILESADKETKQKTRESIRLDMEVDEDTGPFKVSVRMGTQISRQYLGLYQQSFLGHGRCVHCPLL